MNKLEQAARQALEALEHLQTWPMAKEAITALREALTKPKCWCETCRPITMDDMRMVLCPTCGNKRCPHATDHRNACTGSNKPGQKGSSYEHCKPAEQAEQEPVAWLSEGGDVSRSKKFFDDMGFKSSPLYAAPVQQAEQEPVAIIEKEAGFETEVYATGYAASLPDGVFKLYTHPVRTKDLTDDEIEAIMVEQGDLRTTAFARAVIAKFKEKNK